MEPRSASRTAIGAAGHRAVHQVLEDGRIFADPLAIPILGEELFQQALRDAEDEPPARRWLRLFVALRSRFAEDALARAVADGATQLVILGAGLDTFACRSPFGDRLRVIEVDHPATQEWKRARLTDAGIVVPGATVYAPIDFERQALSDVLGTAGFDPGRGAFFTWLGVAPYLSQSAIGETLAYIAGLPGGASVVFDYANPIDARPGGEKFAAMREELARRVAAVGEPFRSAFETDALHAHVRELGFRTIDDVGPARIRARLSGRSPEPGDDRGGHVLLAAT